MRCPVAGIEYNDGMGGTDSFDRLKLNETTSMEMAIISKNWNHRLTFGLLDMSLVNSYIIYREHHPNITHRAFMKQLVEELYCLAKGVCMPTGIICFATNCALF